MKISINWLRDDFKIKIRPDEIKDILTMLGFEVENMEKQGNDIVLELNVTPNRPDCLSHAGIARELYAKSGKLFRPNKSVLKEYGEGISKSVSVKIIADALCPRYSARLITDVKIGDSPDWLKQRLEAVGIRSLNNVVDATNYIMMKLGQPLHAFDLDKISGKKIAVRTAADREQIKTLDGTERILGEGMLVIADSNAPIALAGIMGGEGTEVNQSTRNILLESACFDPSIVRLTSKKLGIETESSLRFGRGVDPEGTLTALDEAAFIISKLTGGRIAKGKIDIYSKKPKTRIVKFNLKKTNGFLGTPVTDENARRILHSLGLKTKKTQKGAQVEIPSFRRDIAEEADLLEEIARHHGYELIPSSVPYDKFKKHPVVKHAPAELIRSILTANGFHEVITYSLISPDIFERLKLGETDPRRNPIQILNPLSQDRSVMRTFLLPGLIESANYNINHKRYDLKLFEIGKAFEKIKKNELTKETTKIAGIITKRPDAGWYSTKREADFFDAKGVIDNILEAFSLNAELKPADEPFLYPNAAVGIYAGGEKIGYAGELLPVVKETFDLKGNTAVFELDIEKLLIATPSEKTYQPLPRLTHIERDIAIIVDKEITSQRLIELSRRTDETLIRMVKVFDVYEGINMPHGKKSIGLRITIQPHERNLTDEEIEGIINNIINTVTKETNAVLRREQN
ncbi:MAG TPA: phenylalanine--tRNA ligase subunit beta [bacterium]